MSDIAGVAQAVPEHDKRTVLLRPPQPRSRQPRRERRERGNTKHRKVSSCVLSSIRLARRQPARTSIRPPARDPCPNCPGRRAAGPSRTRPMATIYKRGRVWWGRVQIRGRDTRQSLKTTSKAVARERLNDWLQRLEDAAWGNKPRRTFEEAMESFVLEHVPTLRPSSQRRYRTSIKMMLEHFEGKYLDQINSSLMAEYEARRRRLGATAPTIRRDLSCLSSMYTHAIVDLEWYEHNPVVAFLRQQRRRGRLKESQPRTRYLADHEEASLLQNAPRDLADQIALAIDTGLRKEEMFSLTWGQLSLARHEIVIPRAVTKGNRDRTVPLLPRSARILAQLPHRLRPAGGPDWVFCKDDGARYQNRNRAFKTAARRAGLDNVIWHDLRRTCGCRLLQDRRLSLEEVRDWLGHMSVQQTERAYAFLRVDQLHRSARTGTEAGTEAGTRVADNGQERG